MKKGTIFLLTCLFILGLFSIGDAALITIGTADYDFNNDGNSVMMGLTLYGMIRYRLVESSF